MIQEQTARAAKNRKHQTVFISTSAVASSITQLSNYRSLVNLVFIIWILTLVKLKFWHHTLRNLDSPDLTNSCNITIIIDIFNIQSNVCFY